MIKEANKSPTDLKKAVEIGGLLREVGGWIFGVAALAISVVLWIQTQGNDKYYPKLAGENLEKQLTRVEQKLDSLEDGNREVIRLLGRLEASSGTLER